jgi:hypothetical protein
MAVFENISLHYQIFSHHPFDRVAAAIDQRRQIFYDNSGKGPKHGPSIN